MPQETIFDWSTACQKAFDTLKQNLCEASVFRHPNYSKEFFLTTDANNQGLRVHVE